MKDHRTGIGRAASCRVCNPSGPKKPSLFEFSGPPDEPECGCIVHCGHEKCTGTKRPEQVPPRYLKSHVVRNPQGTGGPTRKPPPYNGPKGKA